jgi:CRP-like cAMP-binding protein
MTKPDDETLLSDSDVELMDDEPDEPERALARAVLPKTALYPALDEERLAEVIAAVRLVELPAGQVAFRQGVRGDAMYVIAEGEVAVLRETETTEHELARLGEGAFFGEIALLTSQPRNATVRAVSATRLLALDRDAVGRLCRGSPALAKLLMRFVRERLIGSLMETNPLFAPFTADERFSLVERFDLIQLDEGAVILDEGQRAPGFFVLLTGRALGTLEGNPVLELGPGDILGEVSLLTDGLAVATVRTQSRSMALQLPRDEFQDVIMTHPQILEYAAGVAEERRKQVDAWRAGKAVFHEGRLKLV